MISMKCMVCDVEVDRTTGKCPKCGAQIVTLTGNATITESDGEVVFKA